MPELGLRCTLCGCEDISVAFDQSVCQITCDGCQAASTSGDLRSEDLSEGVDAQTTRGQEAPQRLGRVYFISSSDPEAPIKIGHTTSAIEDRIRVLQTGHPAKLEILAEIQGAIRLETALHRIFEDARVFGEWFRRDPKLMGLIRGLSSSP